LSQSDPPRPRASSTSEARRSRISAPPREELDERLGASDAAVFETFVVPRYLALFGELVLELLVPVDGAQVVHLFCRTGYPDRGILLKIPSARVLGVDPSPDALALARAKAALAKDAALDYLQADGVPIPVPDGSFSHALAMHPPLPLVDRGKLLAEMHRLLTPHGQALFAIPMRGSFTEVADLLREFALKHDAPELALAIDEAMGSRPTADSLAAELVAAGFDYVDVDLKPAVLTFEGGRDFVEDPVCRLLLFEEFRRNLGAPSLERPLGYVREAIDKYWSDSPFELTVHVGCATARRRP
jgi:SAM-dependent methyltransferase